MTPHQAVAAYQRQYGRLRARTVAAVVAAWRIHGGVTEQNAERFVRAAVATVEGSQAATAVAVAGYFAAVTREVAGRATPAAIRPTSVTTEALRGVPGTEVYGRPVVDVRTALSQGKPFEVAMELGSLRAAELAETGVILAQRAATIQAVGADQQIVGYRRVLTGESCALCATASTQRYTRGDLHPIHVGCDCSTAPVVGTEDPGQTINQDLLASLKAEGGPEYWKGKGFGVDEHGVIRVRRDVPVLDDAGNAVRLPSGRTQRRMELGEPLKPTVRRHGELGPVLVDPRHEFTGPAGLAA